MSEITITKLIQEIVGTSSGYRFFMPLSEFPERFPGITAAATRGRIVLLPSRRWERVVSVIVEVAFRPADKDEWTDIDWFHNMDLECDRSERVAVEVLSALVEVRVAAQNGTLINVFRLVVEAQQVFDTTRIYAPSRGGGQASVSVTAQIGYIIADQKQCGLLFTTPLNLENCQLAW